MLKMELVLPYPPSVNKVWRFSRKGMYLNPAVKKYRDLVCVQIKQIFGKNYNTTIFPDGNLRLEIKMVPPDRRTRDIDNILKVTLDALEQARVYHNDVQIHQLYVEKLPPVRKGMLEIVLFRL